MGISLIDVAIEGIKTFRDERFYIDFRNEKRVTAADKEDHVVTQLAGTNYRNHVIAIAGINASGKTTAVKLIKFVLKVFLHGTSLSNVDDSLASLFRDELTVHAHFLNEDTRRLYQLRALIARDDKPPVDKMRFVFREEIIFERALTSKETKSSFMQFSDEQEKYARSDLDTAILKFLKEENSILPAFIGNAALKDNYIWDNISLTDVNVTFTPAVNNLVLMAYFDPSIESLTPVFTPDDRSSYFADKYRLKFFGAEEVEVEGLALGRYLSSGTIKGLEILNALEHVLARGGYLIIDEIEIHFNKVIVQNLISFFQSDTNKKGATLIFSTHYSELLDFVRRPETIKVLAKNAEGISMDSLTHLAKSIGKDRTDIKSSDLILSGVFNTAPSYEQYWGLHKWLKQNTFREPSMTVADLD